MDTVSESSLTGGDVESPPVKAGGHPRLKLAAGIIITSVLTLVVISLLTFAATGFKSAEDVARSALGRQASPEALAAYAEERGLNDSIVVRYGRWASDFVQGDMGESLVTSRPVADDVLPRMRVTLTLAVLSLVIAVPVSVVLGVYMAQHIGSARDMTLLLGGVVLAALPEFIIAIALIMVFGVWLGWLPVDASALAFGTFSQKALAYVLPTMALVLAMVPHISRIAREAAAEALAAPYVEAATLRGLSPRRVTWDHAMRNASVPLVNAVALNVVYLLGGVIVVENVFAIPGIGQLFVQAIGAGDSPMVLAITVLLGIMFIGISLIADMLVVYFNPRLRAAR